MSAIHPLSAIHPRRPRGVMLVEILLALAITGMVAAGVASLLFATATGTQDRQETRQRNVRVEVLAHRIDTAIRSSSMLLARDTRCLVFWTADRKTNGVPNLSELRRIEWDNSKKQVICYEAPATLADASNTPYDPATTDFLTTTASLRGSASFPATVWANNVRAWDTSTSPIDVTPTTRKSIRLIGYGFTIDLPTAGQHATRSSAALRGTMTSAG